MSSIKDQTISSVKWSAIEKFVLQGMQFVLGLCMARLLLPSDYGIVGMIAIFLAVSQTFVDSGFGSALIRKLDRTETDFSTVFYFNIIVAIFFYLVLFFCAPFIATFFRTPILCAILRVQSLTLIISSLIEVQNAKLTIELNFKALAKRSILATLISGLIGIGCAYCSLGVWSLVIQALLREIINVVFMWIYLPWKPMFVFSWSSFRELGSFGSKLLASNLLHTIYMNLTTLVIGKCFSAKDLGYYNRGTQFAKLPVDTMNSVLGKVLYPILVKYQDDDEKLINMYRKYICVMSIFIFFGCTLLAAIAKPLILILLTEKWVNAIIYLQIFSFSIMFDHICSINLNLLMVKGRSDLFLRLEIIKKIISVLILFASIPFGVIGICVSKIIYTQIAIFINTYYTGKLFSLGYFSQIKDFGKYFIISLFACLPTYLLTFVHIPNSIALTLGILFSCIIWYVYLQKDQLFVEVCGVFVNKVSHRKL